jgi:ubiquinone/menaquinone biosynthesis C-methylase UbiE
MMASNKNSTKAPNSCERDSSGWSAPLYNRTASFVYSPASTAPVLDLLNARPGERILDVGCGSGEITMILQDIVEQAPGGLVVGTDASQSMVRHTESLSVDGGSCFLQLD